MRQKRPDIGLELEHFDGHISERTVIRICLKVFGKEEVLDLRLWHVDKQGKLYPGRGQGICMRASSWELALKLFKDNHLPRTRTDELTVDSTVPQTDS